MTIKLMPSLFIHGLEMFMWQGRQNPPTFLEPMAGRSKIMVEMEMVLYQG
jgi:hypothetical protein